MFFMPRAETVRKACMEAVAGAVVQEGLAFLGWREVPVD
jgi:glutamate synthase (NADPH/NADH) large chain